ncbi:hypothetical protein [Chroococcidiopsis sp.]
MRGFPPLSKVSVRVHPKYWSESNAIGKPARTEVKSQKSLLLIVTK